MRVGILTMNYHANYGGMLQCVALRRTLESWGCVVEVVRFAPKNKGRFIQWLKLLFFDFSFHFLGSKLYATGKDFLSRLMGKKKALSLRLLEKCKLFVDRYIHYTEPCDERTIGQLIQRHKFDIVIIGSDKIWGEISREKLVYMGDWNPPFEGKILSYAACSSFPFIPRYNTDKIHSLLKKFSAISVRDSYTYNLLTEYSDLDIKIVLDPVFLYDFAPFLEKQDKDPYIFTYILGSEIKGGHGEILKMIKRKYGNIKVKAFVLSINSTNIVPFADEMIDDADPIEWLNAIYNADFIYTDSFHGIAFSLKFQKPFVAYYAESSRATRLVDLRDRLNLKKQIISSVSDAKEKEAIESELDYVYINERLKEMKEESIRFLRSCLSCNHSLKSYLCE